MNINPIYPCSNRKSEIISIKSNLLKITVKEELPFSSNFLKSHKLAYTFCHNKKNWFIVTITEFESKKKSSIWLNDLEF